MDKDIVEFSKSLSVVSRHFKKSMSKITPENLGHSMKDCQTIQILSEDKMTMSQLSLELNLTPGSTTTHIEKLVDSGIVKREYDKKDRRKVYICLNGEGKKICKKMIETHLQISKDILDSLNEAEKKQFTKLMKKISENLADK